MNTKIKHSFKEIMREISESKILKVIICGFGILVVVCAIFEAGVIAGFHKASFERDWGDNYSRNFGPRGAQMMPENFPNAHGAVGRIIKIELPTIIVEDKDNTEKVVLISDTTQIRKMREVVKKEDLTLDTSVVVIGSPDAEGQIEARLIRILPVPLEGSPATPLETNAPKN
jgi:hypothetical protein